MNDSTIIFIFGLIIGSILATLIYYIVSKNRTNNDII
jgi:hypothetical protein